MENNKNFRSGFVTLIGRPNAGKSSLLNALVGKKISIVSSVPQTTRHHVRGILNLPGSQIVFVDTPGIHSFRQSLALHLNEMAENSATDVELLVYVADLSREPGHEESAVMKLVLEKKRPVIIAFNKIDLGKGHLDRYLQEWKDLAKKMQVTDPAKYYIPVSALSGKNLDRLLGSIVSLLPVQPPFYPAGVFTDFPEEFRVADIIREKLYLRLKDELPYNCAISVVSFEKGKRLVRIEALVYVTEESHKPIVIGKGGSFIKETGIAARRDLEALFKKKVFLGLKVKVVKDWQEQPELLKRLGYWWV